jgi:hypothetical protein
MKALQDCGGAGPRVTVARATPVAPLPPKAQGLGEALLQAGGMPMAPGVMGVPTAFGGQPLAADWQPEVPMLLAPRGDAWPRGPEVLPGGAALAVLFPLASPPPSALQPQALAAGGPGGSGAPERDQPRLGRRQLQSAGLSTLPSRVVEACCRCVDFKRTDDLIRVVDQARFPSTVRLDTCCEAEGPPGGQKHRGQEW